MFDDAFTVVDDQAHLVNEQALRERFVEFYGGTVPLTTPTGSCTMYRQRSSMSCTTRSIRTVGCASRTGSGFGCAGPES